MGQVGIGTGAVGSRMGMQNRSTSLSRRDFLRLASIVGGSALLAACQQTPAPAAKPTEAAKPAAPAAAAPTAPPAAKPAEAAKPVAAAPTTAPAPAAAPKKGGTLNY